MERLPPILVAIFALVGVDMARMMARGASGELPLMALVALGLGCLVILPLVWARRTLSERIEQLRPRWHAAAGLLDGALLLFIWNNAAMRRALPRGQLVGLLCALAVGWGLMRLLARQKPRLPTLAAAAVLPVAVYLAWLLPWKSHHWTRFGFDLVAVVALTHLLTTIPMKRQRLMGTASLGIAVVSILCVEPILRNSTSTRQLLHHRSIHARGWALPALSLADGDGDGAVNVLGGVDCDDGDPNIGPGSSEIPNDGVDSNCEGGDGDPWAPSPHPPTASAQDADVLVLSIDALRWDMLDEIPNLRAALGPHATLQRAISPSSRTIDTLSAILRGRPVRGLQLRGKATRRMPTEDPNPTIADLLTAHDYRAITVPTHRYLAAKHNIFAGFEILEPKNFDYVVKAPYTIGQPKPTVPAPDALARLLSETETQKPVLAWVHLMEAHDPYRWSATEHGPRTEAAMRKSLRYVDGLVADALTAWKQDRDRPTVVIILGDHGEEFDEHGGHYHGSTVYAEQVRVVTLLAGPGVPPIEVDAPLSTAAVPATILDLLGLPAHETQSVRSLLPCLRDTSVCPDLAVSEISSDVRVSVGYTGPRFRLVYDPVNRVESLYDSETDPFEQTDVASERPEELATLRARARAWDERH